MLSTFVASVWAARNLGPDKLGVSGFVIVAVQMLNVSINFLPSDYLVRAYHHSAGADLRDSFIRDMATILLSLYLVVATVCLFASLLFFGVSSVWTLSLVSGSFLFVSLGCGANWLLQAQEKQHRQYVNLFVVSLLTLMGNLAIISVNSPAGVDLAVQAGAGMVGAALTWRFAGFRVIPLGRVNVTVALGHLKKSFWIFIGAMILYAYLCVDLLLVGLMNNVAELGQYRTAHQLNSAIQSILWMIPAFLYPRFIIWAKESAGILWRRQLGMAAVAFCALCAVVPLAFLLSGYAYGIVYGEQYQQAAIPFAWLFTSKMMMLTSSFFMWGLWAQSKDKTMIGILSAGLVIEILSCLVMIPRWGMTGAAASALLSSFCVFAMSVLASWASVRREYPRRSRN